MLFWGDRNRGSQNRNGASAKQNLRRPQRRRKSPEAVPRQRAEQGFSTATRETLEIGPYAIVEPHHCRLSYARMSVEIEASGATYRLLLFANTRGRRRYHTAEYWSLSRRRRRLSHCTGSVCCRQMPLCGLQALRHCVQRSLKTETPTRYGCGNEEPASLSAR